MALTGDGAEVQVVPDDLLQLVVHRALLEAQVEVVAQVLVYHASWRNTKGRGGGVRTLAKQLFWGFFSHEGPAEPAEEGTY